MKLPYGIRVEMPDNDADRELGELQITIEDADGVMVYSGPLSYVAQALMDLGVQAVVDYDRPSVAGSGRGGARPSGIGYLR